MTLTQVELRAGQYLGHLVSKTPPPVIEFVHDDRVIARGDIVADAEKDGHYRVTAELPGSVLSDGVQVIAIRGADGSDLGHLSFVAGEALDQDFRAELALLRAEVELLKHAFRRHCAETGKD